MTPRASALFAHQLIVVTGKGGVGKTTVATALAVAAARRGLRTIVAEVAARDDVSRTLGGEHAARDREVELAFGVHHISIEPEEAMHEYLVDQLPSRTLAAVLVESRTFTYLVAATPGMRELLTIGKVWELAQEQRRRRGDRPYDVVILDAPATGHGIATLTAPHTFAKAARVGRIARQASTIDALVTDPRRTAVVAVARPEEMPVNETLQLRGALEDQVGLPLTLAVVNRVTPGRFTAAEVRTLAGCAQGPAVRAVLRSQQRSRAQRAQVARLRRGLACPVVSLRDLFYPALDSDSIAALAGELERVL
ncbi:MAG TPA: ArsA-related P-loop ATPase [Solirubrobacteraceae bacterium]|nr:ArsA-related P-loop ATPase [Solirubrobacteraceae bacterium]